MRGKSDSQLKMKMTRIRNRARALGSLLNDLEAVFLNDRIGEYVLGDFLELLLRLVTRPAVQIQHKKLALADVSHRFIAEAGQRMLNGLALWIEYGALRHYPNVCSHGENYSSLIVARGRAV